VKCSLPPTTQIHSGDARQSASTVLHVAFEKAIFSRELFRIMQLFFLATFSSADACMMCCTFFRKNVGLKNHRHPEGFEIIIYRAQLEA
jgi:hypothetical protein